MKLIRDKAPDIMRKEGKSPITRTAGEEEFRSALMIKLKEEVNEFLAKKERGELIDILEVVYTIAKDLGMSQADLEKMRMAKLKDRGGFDKKIIWEGNKS